MSRNLVIASFALPSFVISILGGGGLHSGVFAIQSAGGQTAVVQQGASQGGNGGSAANIPGGATDISENWAGYVATDGTFSGVGASWTVPQSTAASSSLSADATWIGIGGVTNADLIQAGTQTVFQNGSPSYEAWYELLPATSVTVPLAVHPGDEIAVAIAESPAGTWSISFSDGTTGQSYSASVNYQSSLSSAEWIEEMPSDNSGFVPLDNFGTVSFANGYAVLNGSRVTIEGSGAQSMTMMTNAGQALASPSAFGTDGASFAITRTDVPFVNFRRGGGRSARTGVGVQGYAPPATTITRRRGGGFGSGFGGFGRQQGSSFFRTFGNLGSNLGNFVRNGWNEHSRIDPAGYVGPSTRAALNAGQ